MSTKNTENTSGNPSTRSKQKKKVSERKSLNISLQAKQYSDDVKKVLESWEDNNLNLSVEVCKNILLADKISKSATLLNVINMYEFAEKTLNFYKSKDDDDYDFLLETILSNIIFVDSSKLNEVLFNLSQSKTINRPSLNNYSKPTTQSRAVSLEALNTATTHSEEVAFSSEDDYIIDEKHSEKNVEEVEVEEVKSKPSKRVRNKSNNSEIKSKEIVKEEIVEEDEEINSIDENDESYGIEIAEGMLDIF